jgi:dihydrolipoamide dehydrogenase
VSKINTFDLIVIGSGSGLDVVNAIYNDGLKVAIIEKDKMGGTCLNRGCVPSKLLIHSADISEIIKSAHTFGIKIDSFSIDFASIVDRVNDITDSQSDEIKNAFANSQNPRLFSKKCRFIGEKTIAIDNEQKIYAQKILIACGTRPRIPKIRGLEGSGYITSDEALRLRKQPKVLTIIGGGYISCELAHFFGALGTKINIIQRDNVLIPSEDEEISEKFTKVFSKKYNVNLSCEVEFVSKRHRNDYGDDYVHDSDTATRSHYADNDDSIFQVLVKDSSGKSKELLSDQLLVAAGRIPNSDTLDLEKTGVKVNKRGFIITDRYLETTSKGIFALGDAVGRYLFKHNANHEAWYVYNNMMYPDRKVAVNYAAMPHAIFSSPQVAAVGFIEQEIKRAGKAKAKHGPPSVDYVKSVYPYINTAMGLAIEDRDGFVKFLVDKKSRKILGCHIIGSQASILIHEVLVAMRSSENSNTIDNITRAVHIHPALSEVVVRAAHSIQGKI